MARKIDIDAIIERIRMENQPSVFAGDPASGYSWLYVTTGSSPHGGLYLEKDDGSVIGPFITGTAIGEWTDYSTGSSIVGWSSYTTKDIFYKRNNGTVFVQFNIVGTSNNAATSFTLPQTQSSDVRLNLPVRIRDNGTFAVGYMDLPVSSSTSTFYATIAGGPWTASGTKRIVGEFWYEEV